MLAFSGRTSRAAAELAALDRSLATIAFGMDGVIRRANANFLSLMGYEAHEVVGEHHRIFVAPDEAGGSSYRAFWDRLNRGEFQSAEYKRITKNGREVWIQATYNPVLDSRGRPIEIVKFATEITDQKLEAADVNGQIEAINTSQAVIHFSLDGTVLDANAVFLAATGYALDEVKGRHHWMFMEPEQAAAAEYAAFWSDLARGRYRAGEFKRLAKGGREIWLQASYNPIFDMAGRPFKVMKYAADVTADRLRAADHTGQIAAIHKVQAVISFDLEGTILEANDNFLDTLGYTLAEVKGQKHRMFVTPDFAASVDYQAFWDTLRRGEFLSAVYQRLGKGGREVWIQASYNPILDLNGRPFKVVKFATDITASMDARTRAVAASETTLANVDRVTRATRSMSVSAAALSESMSRSKASVDGIRDRTSAADHSTGQMRNAAQAMTGVVQAISGIAEQINLLALNATIESARAGEAGRGFAVVATEVKNLASQAKAATMRISGEITAMQGLADNVAESLASITTAVGEVHGFVLHAVDAVEKQTTATHEITVNMKTAAQGVANVGRNLDEWVVGVQERRTSDRQRVYEPAEIILPGAPAIDCTVRDISDSGARISLEFDGAFLERFALVILSTGVRRDCTFARRGEGEIGVNFLN